MAFALSAICAEYSSPLLLGAKRMRHFPIANSCLLSGIWPNSLAGEKGEEAFLKPITAGTLPLRRGVIWTNCFGSLVSSHFFRTTNVAFTNTVLDLVWHSCFFALARETSVGAFMVDRFLGTNHGCSVKIMGHRMKSPHHLYKVVDDEVQCEPKKWESWEVTTGFAWVVLPFALQ